MEALTNPQTFDDSWTVNSRRLGPITLDEPIGVGGMAEIWRGWTDEGDVVAVKFLRETNVDDELARRRFARECAITMDLRHPCTVRGLDQGIHSDGRQFLVVDYVWGPSLDAFIAKEKPSALRVLEVMRDICETLEDLHARELFHRDLKPANVMFASSEATARPCLIDFGIASAPDFAPLTEDRELLGTVQYMSPEQVYGSPISPLQVDLWGLSALAYETLVGKPAFDAPSLGELCAAIRNTRFVRPSTLGVGLGESVDAFFEKCFSEALSNRFQSVSEWLESFEEALFQCSEVSNKKMAQVLVFPRLPHQLTEAHPRTEAHPAPCTPRKGLKNVKRGLATAAAAVVLATLLNIADLGELAAQWSRVWPATPFG